MADKIFNNKNQAHHSQTTHHSVVCNYNGPTVVFNGTISKGSLYGLNFGGHRKNNHTIGSKTSGAAKKALKAPKKIPIKSVKYNQVELFPACIGDSASAWKHVKKAEFPGVIALGIPGANSSKILSKMPELVLKLEQTKRQQLIICVGVNDALDRKTGKEFCDAKVCSENWCKIINFANDFAKKLMLSISLPYIRSSLNTDYQKRVSDDVQQLCEELNIHCLSWGSNPVAPDLHHPSREAYKTHFNLIFKHFEEKMGTSEMTE